MSPPCGDTLFMMGCFRQVFLFDTKKEPKKCPLLPIAREARLRGCSPLRTPKRRSRSKKAKKRRSAAFFLTLFHFSPIDPSGAECLYPHSVGADACIGPHRVDANLHVGRRGRRCGVAQRSMPQWGIEPHERASFAGWRRSLCAAKRRRPVQPCVTTQPQGEVKTPPYEPT